MNERGEVVYVLLLLQAAAGLLASLGEVLLMGTPLYLVVPVVRAIALFVLAAAVLRGGRRALVVVIVVEWLGLLGFWLGVLLGLLPGLAPSTTLMALLTEVALPAAVIVLGARILATRPAAARTRRGRPRRGARVEARVVAGVVAGVAR